MKRTAALLWALLPGVASALPGQAPSRYVPIEGRITPYVEHLVRAGVIDDPKPLTRPFKRHEILAALAATDTTGLQGGVRATIRYLREELSAAGGTPHAGLELWGGTSFATHARRDPLRETGGDNVSPHFGAQLDATIGPAVMSIRPYSERRLTKDPDWAGRRSTTFAGRFTDTYVSLQAKYGEMFFGRMGRNWGPPGFAGMLISPQPYSYDHLAAHLGTRALRMEALITQLDDFADSTGNAIRRYWASYRLVLQPEDWLTASFTHGTLWQGVGRGWELHWLNPFTLSFMTRNDEGLADSINSVFGFELRLAFPQGTTLQGSLLVDDLSSIPLLVSLGGAPSSAQDRFAATGLVDIPFSPVTAVRLLGTVVTSLAYRSPQGPEYSLLVRNVGLGRNFSDYAQVSLIATVLPQPMVVISPEVTLLFQGEGDIRDPFPPIPDPTIPTVFIGTVERTLRVAVGARAQLFRSLDLDLNAGLHHIGNSGHVLGMSKTRFVGRLGISYSLGWNWRLD